MKPTSTVPDPSPNEPARQRLRVALDALVPMPSMLYEDLVVIPLGSSIGQAQAGYVTLADADGLAPGQAPPFEFSELDSGGRVPTVQVKVGPVPLVVIAGETIIGGKQNRAINVSMWLAAGTTTPIPVTCLEHGRWNAPGKFAAGLPVDHELREKLSRGVGQFGPDGRFMADQMDTWARIADREHVAGRYSDSQAVHDLYKADKSDVDSAVEALPAPHGAFGMAVGIGGRLVGLDVFDSTEALARQWPRLVASAALAWLDFRRRVGAGLAEKPDTVQPDDGALGRMLERAKKAAGEASVTRSPGEGLDIRLGTRKLHGSALVFGDRVVHVALFRDEPPKPRKSEPPPRELDRPSGGRHDVPARDPARRLSEMLERLSAPSAPDERELVGAPVRRPGR